MKNWKKFLLVILILCLSLTVLPKHSIADFGDFESYDSGGWDSDSDWGSSSSWDSDWGSSSSSYNDDGYYSGGGSSGGGFIILIVIIVIIVIMTRAGKNGTTNTHTSRPMPQRSTYYRDENRSAAVANKIMEIDPHFNSDTFIANAKNLFVKLQNAWADRDLETLRPLVTSDLFDQYSKNIQNYIDGKRINKLERIATNFGELVSFSQDNEKDTLVVAVNSSMVDYIIDEETGKILKGDNSTKITNTYKMTFIRKKGIMTQEGTSKLKTTNCPNCGAPTTITSSGRCPYCNSVITTGSHDWVLSGIERY